MSLLRHTIRFWLLWARGSLVLSDLFCEIWKTAKNVTGGFGQPIAYDSLIASPWTVTVKESGTLLAMTRTSNGIQRGTEAVTVSWPRHEERREVQVGSMLQIVESAMRIRLISYWFLLGVLAAGGREKRFGYTMCGVVILSFVTVGALGSNVFISKLWYRITLY